MDAINEIFTEYVSMRQNGLDGKAALHTLRPFVETLSEPERNELARRLSAWEKQDIPPVPGAAPGTPQRQSSIKPLRPSPQQTEQRQSSIKSLRATATDTNKAVAEERIICANCGKGNRAADSICYFCGQLLDPDNSQFSTRRFNTVDVQTQDKSYFGAGAVLTLHVQHANYDYELHPQTKNYEIIIGRSTANSAMMPDIDLAECGGGQMGVSRLHLALRYIPEDNALQVYDLGSANGSFINGQQLRPKEVRIIRSGDELRLGRLAMIVHF